MDAATMSVDDDFQLSRHHDIAVACRRLCQNGHVDGAYTPTWNALNFLQVPQLHFVSAVADFVTAPRLSVSGWVRQR